MNLYSICILLHQTCHSKIILVHLFYENTDISKIQYTEIENKLLLVYKFPTLSTVGPMLGLSRYCTISFNVINPLVLTFLRTSLPRN